MSSARSLTAFCLASLLVLAATGCRDKQNFCRPAGDPAAQIWTDRVELPLLGVRVALPAGQGLLRDDGFYAGDLRLRTKDLRAEFAPAKLVVSGTPAEGLIAEFSAPAAGRRFVIYALASGEPERDAAVRETLRAAVLLRLGRRADLEAAFRARNVRLQMGTMSDKLFLALVEVHALAKQGQSIQWLEGAERQQAAELLMAQGVGDR